MLYFYGEELLAPLNPQAGELPIFGYPRLLVKYIHNQASYPEVRCKVIPVRD
jgi:hypothetical protein